MRPLLQSEKQKTICSILSVGGSFAVAAKYVGCSRSTIYKTAKRDRKFRVQLKQAQCGTEITLLNAVREASKDVRHWQAARWALTHMYPDRYQRKPRTMALADVKDLIAQLMRAVVHVVPNPTLREDIRVQFRSVAGPAIRKAKEQGKEKPRGH